MTATTEGDDLTKLMELTAELSVVSECLDEWHVQQINKKLADTIDANFKLIDAEFERVGIHDYNRGLVRQCVSYCSQTSAEIVNTHVTMMERNLGLVSETTPHALVAKACKKLSVEQYEIIQTYWNDV